MADQASRKGRTVNRRQAQAGRRIAALVVRVAGALIAGSILAVLLFRFVPVPATPLMAIRAVERLTLGKPWSFAHHWVPLEAMSGYLPLAVICSEDQNFPHHAGFDFEAIEQAVEAHKKGAKRLRGGSTISQQTAKNVFLWPGRSWLRKGLEAYFTVLIELAWSKRRILEVYLNSIEMGDGIYGAEAASRHYFHKSAKDISRTQAAALAAILPNPRHYRASPPSPYINSRIRWIIGQMGRQPPLDLD